MKKRFISILTVLAVAVSVQVMASDSTDVSTTIKTILNSIRYGKHDNAIKLVDIESVSKTLMGKNWDKMSPAEKSEFMKNIEILIRKISFPEGEKLFKHLDTVKYGKPVIKGSKARCKATIVVYKDYKKEENAIDFELVKINGQWKVVEMYILEEGVFDGIYQDEIKPVLKKGGIPAVLDAVRKKVAEVSR